MNIMHRLANPNITSFREIFFLRYNEHMSNSNKNVSPIMNPISSLNIKPAKDKPSNIACNNITMITAEIFIKRDENFSIL